MPPRQTPSEKIIKKPPLKPPQQQLHHQEPPPPRRPVVIYTITSKVLHVEKGNFAAIVQKLTGKQPTASPSTTPPTVDAYPGSLSPESRFAAMENANLAIQRPTPAGILSPGPAFLPPITPDFFFPVPTSTTDPQDLGSFDFLLPPPSMADGYWNQQRHHQPPMSSIPHGGPPKRHRSDFGHDMHSYLSRDEDRSIPHSVKDTRTIGSAYDLYLQSVQTPSVPSEEVGRFNGVGMGRPGGNNVMHSPSMGELMTGRGGVVVPPDFGPHGRGMGFGQQDLVGRPSRELLRLPPDATNTLYVEGLPSNCSRREVAHIFRPFRGYKEVRLVNKDSKQRNGDPIVLCFVDFGNPACAATARIALQGYRMDEDEPDSKILQIQFSRNPGPRPGQRGGRR